MTMRVDSKYEIGERGAVYEFKVKLSTRLRGVNISDFELEEETTVAIDEFAEHLRRDYPWVGDVYRTGRSGGWLAIEDAKGQATEEQLDEINTRVDQARSDFETAIIESFGYTENGRQLSLRGVVGIDPKLRKAYDFFREHGGGIVGESGKSALNLARAEAYAKAHDWEFEWEDDPEPYDRGDTEDEPSEVLTCLLRDDSGKVLESLGGIGFGDDSRANRDYKRVVEAELALEAMPESELVKNSSIREAQPMSSDEKGRKIVEMQRQWYRTRARAGAAAADKELERSMNAYFDEVHRRDNR